MNILGDAASALLLAAVCLRLCVEAVQEVEAECHSDVSLPCEAEALSSNDYRSLTWYKNHTGILKKKGGNTTLYNPRPAALGPQGQLVLPRVTPNDSGTYGCLLMANLGGENHKSSVNLSVTACILPMEETPSPSLLPALERPLLVEVMEVHVGWAFLSFSSLCLLKIIICLVSVKVFAKVRGSRRQGLGSQRSRRSQS